MKVLKFGGTSMANTKCFLRVAEILRNNTVHGQIAVVLSAPEKVTNHLVNMIEKTVCGQDFFNKISEIKLFFYKLLKGLSQEQPGFPSTYLKNLIDEEFSQIRYMLHNISLFGSCPDNINASLICIGEKLSIKIMASLLEARGHNVTIIDPVKKLLAVGNYLESTVDITESTRRIIANKIPSNNIILMAGFIAGNEKGELVVLGRNGSDYSAAVLAACLRAECCEIWTDVDGFYTCDPNYVPEAILLQSISYQEAIDLSYFGAKILHPRAISTVAQLDIPCLIKNTYNPQAPGTLISANIKSNNFPVKGISNLNNMKMFSIIGSKIKSIFWITSRFFTAMYRSNISVILITQSWYDFNISFCVAYKDYLRTRCVLEEEFYFELKYGSIELLEVQESLAIISVIGNGTHNLRRFSTKSFAALLQANIDIVAIAQRFSNRFVSIVVHNDNVTTSVQITHRVLFNTNQLISAVKYRIFDSIQS